MRAARRSIERLKANVEERELAAVVLLPIAGKAGHVVPASGFMSEIAAWARRVGAWVIADERYCGVNTTRTPFALRDEGVFPDYLVAATEATGEGEALLIPIAANPRWSNDWALAAPATTEVDWTRDAGAALRGGLSALLIEDDRIGDVRGRGAVYAVEVIDPATQRPDPVLAGRLCDLMNRRGSEFAPSGPFGNVIVFMPSANESLGAVRTSIATLRYALAATR